MGTLSERDKSYLAQNFLAFFRRDYRRVATAHIESGWVPPDTRVDELESEIRVVLEPIFDKPLKEISLGKVLVSLFRASRRFNVEIQPQLVLLQKTLLNVEGLGRELDPDLDLWVTAKPFLERWMTDQIGWRALERRLREEAPFLATTLPLLPRLIYQRLSTPPAASDAVLLELAAAQRARNRWLAVVAVLLACCSDCCSCVCRTDSRLLIRRRLCPFCYNPPSSKGWDTPAMALLEIKNVTRRFGTFEAVKNVSFDVDAGEFFTLLGPSGCGKTTILRMIAGFDLPDEGSIVLDGVDLKDTPPEKRPIHTVFQSYALFPHMTVVDNVAFPLKMAGAPPTRSAPRSRRCSSWCTCPEKGDQFPHELSGGQKQRVALARSLVNRPRLLLLDEPLGALDAKLREQLQVELMSLQRDVGVTFVFVTHSQAEALALSHRIAVMNAGRIEQLDEPSKIYGFPNNRFVADFIGNCNLLDATVTARQDDALTLASAGLGHASPRPPGRESRPARGVLALRPEMVRIFAPMQRRRTPDLVNRFHGKVREYVYIGDVTTYIVFLDNGQKIEALAPNAGSGRARFFETGDEVQVAWRSDAGHFVLD